MRNLLEASHKLTTSSSLSGFTPEFVLGGDGGYRHGRLERLVLSTGLVSVLVAGSALLLCDARVNDELQNRGLRVAASQLSSAECVVSAPHHRRAHCTQP